MLDYSQVIERTEKMKRRWLRVIENKERMQVESQRMLRSKYDKAVKLDKAKRKRATEDKEDHEIMIEKRKEKLQLIHKRKEHQDQEFERALKQKEMHYKKKMEAMMQTHHKR